MRGPVWAGCFREGAVGGGDGREVGTTCEATAGWCWVDAVIRVANGGGGRVLSFSLSLIAPFCSGIIISLGQFETSKSS
jgi:hypothetical protein